MQKLVDVLNAHLTALQSIDDECTQLQVRIEEQEKKQEAAARDVERVHRGGAAASRRANLREPLAFSGPARGTLGTSLGSSMAAAAKSGSACLPLVGECANAADGYFRNLAAGATASEAAAAGPPAGAAERPGKGAGETPVAETAKAERLLEAARGLLAGLGPLQRAVEQCTWYAAASQERRISQPLEGAVREAQRRTLELVRALEHADAAYVQLLAAHTAASKTSAGGAGGGVTKAESAGGLPLHPASASLPSASQSSSRWETQSDHLVEVSAAVTTAHRILLRELRPQLSTLARHIDARGLRSLLLNVHGAAGEFGAAWSALTAVLLDAQTENQGPTVAESTVPAGAAQSADLDNWVLPGGGQHPNGPGPPAQKPHAREQAPTASVRVPPGADATPPQPASASVHTAPLPPQPVPASVYTTPQPPPQQPARQWSVPYPDSRLCTTAEVAAAVAESVLRLLDDSLAAHNEEIPGDIREFARQVTVVRQAIGRLVSAVNVYGDPPGAGIAGFVTANVDVLVHIVVTFANSGTFRVRPRDIRHVRLPVSDQMRFQLRDRFLDAECVPGLIGIALLNDDGVCRAWLPLEEVLPLHNRRPNGVTAAFKRVRPAIPYCTMWRRPWHAPRMCSGCGTPGRFPVTVHARSSLQSGTPPEIFACAKIPVHTGTTGLVVLKAGRLFAMRRC
ncbi:MAG: hypothetical protein BJ554DRAFT_5452 [Olpidium bornovanus]|uniref:Uncharacterized protein n=1 Tax=Olpidium bornovanus TaxID=278681 RepID=A0A8H8DLH5_9FUNG|nr:MAG: hypothetical protein BJ554DRAFT_5452 [Olpidium bornovanus]